LFIRSRTKIAKIIFIIICFLGLSVASGKSLLWYLDSKETVNQIEELNKIVKSTEIQPDNKGLLINPHTEEDDIYWKYVKMPMIDIDISKLKDINPETIGWIQVLGTNINYPFVQHDDNEFYLNHSFNKQKNGAGWPFLDYRNDIDYIDKNNIIYAHGRINSVLFGTLKNLTKSSWYSNSDNHIIKVSTQTHNSLWQVFSVYHIPTTSDYLVTRFKNEETFENFLNFIKDRSIYDFNTNLSEEDKIITLSTCYSSNEKVVMHAKLIKLEEK